MSYEREMEIISLQVRQKNFTCKVQVFNGEEFVAEYTAKGATPEEARIIARRMASDNHDVEKLLPIVPQPQPRAY